MLEKEADFMVAMRRVAQLRQLSAAAGGCCLDDPCLQEMAKLWVAMEAYDKKHHGDRQGAWFPVYSGKRFWPLDPRPNDFDINDIAHALAHINRFNGHLYHSYSVAQHSVLVSQNVPIAAARYGLLHDASEAYLQDIITPLKGLLPDYCLLEERVMRAILTAFDVPISDEIRKAVKQTDVRMLVTEVRDLTPHGVINGVICEQPFDWKITCWSPAEARSRFACRYCELWPERTGA